MIVGVLREGKVPVDHRTPLTPVQAQKLQWLHTDGEVWIQSSEHRCYSDDDYRAEGLKVVDELEGADVLLGVKEVPTELLIPNKTYFFFSHTIKAQEYNRELLQTVLNKNIRLIDYEMLTDDNGLRVIAFGRWAGIVGAYNALWSYGKRYNLYELRRAHSCFDLADLKNEVGKVRLPPLKIVLTGGGRVAKGAMEVLNEVGIRRVSPAEILESNFHEPVYSQLNSRDYHLPPRGGVFKRSEFYQFPERYEGQFLSYARKAEILIAAAYWDPKAPVLFERSDVLRPDFHLKVIADITCDIEGSIPANKRPSTIDEPVYDYNATEDREEPPFSEEGNLTIMAVDNLPCELPRDASESFGEQLLQMVWPHFMSDPQHEMIQRATIAEDGRLGKHFTYLQSFVAGE